MKARFAAWKFWVLSLLLPGCAPFIDCMKLPVQTAIPKVVPALRSSDWKPATDTLIATLGDVGLCAILAIAKTAGASIQEGEARPRVLSVEQQHAVEYLTIRRISR
ncbi:MAG TPA: hypothetical protein PKV97_00205 [Thauera aminoaromatica]|nr:hypothetical protein [Thauera aminoaromatica]